MITKAELEALRNIDVKTLDRDTLVDINDVKVDADAPLRERAQQFFEQIKNPYVYRVGDYCVRIAFTEGGKSLHDILQSYLSDVRVSR